MFGATLTRQVMIALREHFTALIEGYRIRLLRSKDAESSPEL